MTAALTFELGCPDCGHTLTPVTLGLPGTYRTTAILRCTSCQIEAQVIVGLEVTHRPKYRPPHGCGTSRKART